MTTRVHVTTQAVQGVSVGEEGRRMISCWHVWSCVLEGRYLDQCDMWRCQYQQTNAILNSSPVDHDTHSDSVAVRNEVQWGKVMYHTALRCWWRNTYGVCFYTASSWTEVSSCVSIKQWQVLNLWRETSQYLLKKMQNTVFVIFIVAPCILKIHWVLHNNKCTNCILYISLKLFALKHFHCSYMFR
jgi:hypothetical protein